MKLRQKAKKIIVFIILQALVFGNISLAAPEYLSPELSINTAPFQQIFKTPSVYQGIYVGGSTYRNKEPKMAQMVFDTIGRQMKKGARVLEIGTGSGVLTQILAEDHSLPEDVEFVATDINPDAFRDSWHNLDGFSNVSVRFGDLFDTVHQYELFDIIFWNPPWFDIPEARPRNEIARVDEQYQTLRRFFSQVPLHLTEQGKVYLIFPQELSAILWELSEEFRYLMNEANSYETRTGKIVCLYEVDVNAGMLEMIDGAEAEIAYAHSGAPGITHKEFNLQLAEILSQGRGNTVFTKGCEISANCQDLKSEGKYQELVKAINTDLPFFHGVPLVRLKDGLKVGSIPLRLDWVINPQIPVIGIDKMPDKIEIVLVDTPDQNKKVLYKKKGGIIQVAHAGRGADGEEDRLMVYLDKHFVDDHLNNMSVLLQLIGEEMAEELCRRNDYDARYVHNYLIESGQLKELYAEYKKYYRDLLTARPEFRHKNLKAFSTMTQDHNIASGILGSDKYNVLVLCNQNRERSPLAEKVMKFNVPEDLKGKINIESAGLFVSGGFDSTELDIYTSRQPLLRRHVPMQVMEFQLREADVIFVMTLHQKKHLEEKYEFTRGKVFLLLGDNKELDVAHANYSVSGRTYEPLKTVITVHLDRIFQRVRQVCIKSQDVIKEHGLIANKAVEQAI
ncbi:MAG: methyltransferase domain-containing protein [Candidatus Omnitrophota bacterium]